MHTWVLLLVILERQGQRRWDKPHYTPQSCGDPQCQVTLVAEKYLRKKMKPTVFEMGFPKST